MPIVIYYCRWRRLRTFGVPKIGKGGTVLQLMSIEDLAIYLGDSKRTIYKYIASGDCPPYIRLSSKNIKFDREDVDEWLASKKIQPKNGGKK